jgi:hypothetical protein
MLFTGHFLEDNFINKNPYQEHNEMNFEEKIFFHESMNKFFDLAYIKLLAKSALKRVEKA